MIFLHVQLSVSTALSLFSFSSLLTSLFPIHWLSLAKVSCQYSPIPLSGYWKIILRTDHLILKPGWYLLNLFGNEQLINRLIILQFRNPKWMKEFRNLEEKKADRPKTSQNMYQLFLPHIRVAWKIYSATCQSWSIKSKPTGVYGCQKNLPDKQLCAKLNA